MSNRSRSSSRFPDVIVASRRWSASQPPGMVPSTRIVSVEPTARPPETSPSTLGPLAGLGEVDCAEAGPAETTTATRAASSGGAPNASRRITERIFDPAAPRRNVTEVTPARCVASPLGAADGAYRSREMDRNVEEVRRC
jgi:hypothetical protein